MQWTMRVMVVAMLLTATLILGSCVTEYIGVPGRKVDSREVLEKLTELGIGYLQMRNFPRAKDNLRKALEIDSKSPLVHTSFGVLFQLEGEIQLAERHFRLAIKYDPEFTQARNNFGAFLFAEGRFEEAIVQLEVASEDRFYAKRPQVFENLGVCYLRTGALDKAEAAFTRAVELNSSQGRALLELAVIRIEQKNYVQARGLYQRHLAVTEQSARSLWLCIQIARVFEDDDSEASCALLLKNVFPVSEEFEKYAQSSQ